MTYYNLTNISATNTTLELFRAVNTELTDGTFMLLAVISLTIILLVRFNTEGFQEGILITSFIMSVLTGFFWLATLIPLYIFVIAIVILFFSVSIYFLTK